MASDQLRKKWGTVFMGEREASEAQLDAMQEPALRQRRQHQQEEDYLARVRARAEERAREILGAAYTERQKVLEEARAEAAAAVQALTREADAAREEARTALDAARQERQAAAQLREEAAQLRDAAHDAGFQEGMDAAGEELAAFRQELGQSLATLLRRLEDQQAALCAAWREDLTALTLAAVEAGTGWMLQSEHKAILRSLVLEALNLLEERASVSVRVHPDDEATVGDLFQAARERVPELRQWVVTGDPNLEPGDLVAESGSGSVDCRRAYFREMTAGVLAHLALPQRPEEAAAAAELGELVAREAARLAAPEVETPPSAAPAGSETPPATAEAATPVEVEEVLPAASPVEAAPPAAVQKPAAPTAVAAPPAAPTAAAEPPAASPADAASPSPGVAAAPPAAPVGADAIAAAASAPVPSSADVGPDPAPASDAPSSAPAADDAEESLWLPPLGEPLEGDAAPAAAPDVPVAPDAAPDAAPAAASHGGAQTAAPQDDPRQAQSSQAATRPVQSDPVQSGLAQSGSAQPGSVQSGATPSGAPGSAAGAPSLAELEEELFPLEEEAAARNVLTQGGFLPGADPER
ncbi:FliH/SctL family protein [Desulfovibrio legallii]|uniref:Flagellar assembly protein FliH n=1 Tax=Desulfovibrio legallii TaxID=571438 RepID=A0A1G7JTM6_9BACT|nr:FliH/SctL family protein [Desulfovibrio legallii]SDF28317.1 Flagellar biosynthesis/type III secretory pathway protein FliH [Desulfovibrio legallii]